MVSGGGFVGDGMAWVDLEGGGRYLLSESHCGPQSEQLHTLSVSLRWCLPSNTTIILMPRHQDIQHALHRGRAKARPLQATAPLRVRFGGSCLPFPSSSTSVAHGLIVLHQHVSYSNQQNLCKYCIVPPFVILLF